MKASLPPIAKKAIFGFFDTLSIPLYMVTASKEHNYVFFLIHKNGISTILSVLREETQRQLDEEYTIYSHSKYANHFKFCFIRNPWDRLVSCYSNKVARKKLFPECWDKDFDYFVEYISRQPLSQKTTDNHIRMQSSQFPYKKIDHIARFENFEAEYNFIINEKLKLNREIVNNNKSSHAHYTELYTDKSRKMVEQIYKSDIEIGKYKFGE